jgi:hypothetical protein
MVCGSPDIPLDLLKSVATYKGIDANAPLVRWFWDTLEAFSNAERSLFLRFVWGRTRLPRTIADFRGRDFVFQVSQFYLIKPYLLYIFTLSYYYRSAEIVAFSSPINWIQFKRCTCHVQNQ